MIDRRKFLGAVTGTALGRVLTAPAAAAKPSFPAFRPGDEEAYWAKIQSEFRLDPQRVFFNTGTLGSCSRRVSETVLETMSMIDELPTYGYWARGMPSAMKVLEKVATLVGAEPAEVTVTHSTTEGINVIGQGVDLRPGDHVLIGTHEHPGGESIWSSLAEDRGILVDRYDIPLVPKDEDDILDHIERKITPRTRLLLVSHILYSTGFLMPVQRISEIARRRRILYLIDGAHPVGIMPVDVKQIGCDFYAASGHKWLCGPRGTGLLYVRKDHLHHMRRFLSAYPASHVPDDVKGIDAQTSRLNFAWTNNLHDILGLGAAIDFHTRIGAERVLARDLDLISRFKRSVLDIPNVELISTFEGAMASPMATVRIIGKSNKEVFRRLRSEHRITVKETLDSELPVPLNSIRVSTHIYNTPAQVDGLISALREVMTTSGSG
jgi:selenocysteine lyase/cysteine desulfurase